MLASATRLRMIQQITIEYKLSGSLHAAVPGQATRRNQKNESNHSHVVVQYTASLLFGRQLIQHHMRSLG